MDTDEFDELADVHSQVHSNFVSRFSLHKHHGGKLSLVNSNTDLPPSTFGRQTSLRSSSLSSLSTDSGFPMSCGSPSPSTDVSCFDDIDRKSRRTSNTVTSPTPIKRVTSLKSIPSPTRYISVFTSKFGSESSDGNHSLSKCQMSKSLSMSNLAPPKFELHPQDIDSQPSISQAINNNNGHKTVTLSCSAESGSRHIEKEQVICTASITQKESSTDDMKDGEPGSCNSEYPLKTSSPRVPRLTRSLKFPAEVQKPFASNDHGTSESSQTCNRDTMTAQLIAKNAVDLNHGNYSDIDTVKVGAPEQHNPLGSSEPSSHTNRTVIESTTRDAGHRCFKSKRITGDRSGRVGSRHLSTGNSPEYHINLPFSISKFEDTAKTVRKRIPPGMVADMRQMFSVPIKRRQTMPVLSDIHKYKSSLRREFVIPSASTENVITALEMTLTGNSPKVDGGETETTERYFGVDSSLKEKDEKEKLETDDNETKDDIKSSELTVCVQNGSVMDKNDDNNSNSDEQTTEETVPQLQTSVMNVFVQNDSIVNDKDDDTSDDDISDVLEGYSDDSDVMCDEYDVCASKDDVMFSTRRPDDPPSTVNTPSYVDNILRLSRTDLNIDTELKEIKTDKSTDNENDDSLDTEHDRTFNSVEIKTVDDSDVISDDNVTSENKSAVLRHRKVNMYSVINEYKDSDTQKRQSNLCTCINLHTHEGSHGDDNTGNTQTWGVDVQCDDRNVLLTDKTTDLHTKPEASTGEPVSKGKSRLKTDKKNEQIQQRGGINCSRINVSPVAIGNKCTDVDSSINNTPTRSHVTFDKPRADDKVIEACPTSGERDKPEDDHVTLTNNISPQVVSKQCSTPAGVVPGAFSSPQRSDCYGDFSQGIDNMPERSAGPNNNFSEISEYKGGKKVTTKTSTTDVNMNETSEEAKQTLNILAEAMSKLNGDNNEDILPEIKQSVAKLDGGNLVITTLTRKIIEEEEESGRGTPLPDYNDVFYVRDHKGNVYMVEDLTEDSQESAYYSSSNVSQENDYNRIHNLRSIGQTNIDHSTAEEVLLGLYNQGRSTVKIEEIDENEKQLVLHKGNAAANLQNQYSTDGSFNKQSSKYEYDMCNGAPQVSAPWGPRSTSKVKTIKQSYEMTSDGRNCKDGQASEEDIKMETEETSTIKNMDASGCKTMSSSFRYQTDASLLPQQPQEFQAMPPPPMILPPVQPKLVQLDMTPILPKPEMPLMTTVPVTTTKVTESSTDRIVTSTENDDAKMKLSEHGRPVYKSVALVKGPYETPKWQVAKTKTEKVNEDVEDSKRYKLVKSHASNETQQREVSFQNSSTSMFHQISGAMNRAAVNESQNMYKNEQMIHMNGGSVVEPKIHRTRIDVSSPPVPRMDYPERDVCEYSESNRTYTTQKVQSEPVFPARVPSPPRFQASSAEKDMMVVRGNILIKNTMDQGLDQFNDNINMFSKGFNMYKQNPLYQSDEDLQRRLAEEEERERRRQLDQDLAFETCDRYSKTKQVKRDQPPAGRQHLTSQLLLSKLSNIDVKDIRQHIDVQHHNEDIYGDARFMHADGSSTQEGANNFDSVNENIDLVMRGGKAYITITVTAERYTPIDKEFNVWRKSQAVVTRVIEIDFLANTQRRRLYNSVMERAGESAGDDDRYGGSRGQERVLSTKETLDLFSEIMDATEGEGDHEDITVKTKQHRTTLPPHDFLY